MNMHTLKNMHVYIYILTYSLIYVLMYFIDLEVCVHEERRSLPKTPNPTLVFCGLGG